MSAIEPDPQLVGDGSGRAVWRAEPPITRPSDRGGANRYKLTLVAGVPAIALYLSFFAWYALPERSSIWLGFLVGPILFVVNLPLLVRMLNRVEPSSRVRAIVIAGLGGKIVGAYARYMLGRHLLGNNDSGVYHQVGVGLSAEFREFVFGGPFFDGAFDRSPGTNFLRLLTGIIYTLTGTSFTVGFITFTYMSFWGLYLYYRAFAIALPDGNRARYAVLVFFLPSMLFWPSSIGKDAWMSLTIGLATYGLARLLAFRRYAYLCILVGSAGMAAVRPHVAAIFGVGVVCAFILRRSEDHPGATFKKVVGLLLFAIAAGVLMSRLQATFGLEGGLDPNQVFDETGRRTSQGGSQFESARARSPADLPWAVVTVLFRPFLYEAGSASGLVSAIEGTLLAGLFAMNLHRLMRLPSQMIRLPYVGFVVLYTLVFVFAFSSINNFGILSRQRAQLFPIATVLLCTPVVETFWSGRRRRLLEGQKQPGAASVKISLTADPPIGGGVGGTGGS